MSKNRIFSRIEEFAKIIFQDALNPDHPCKIMDSHTVKPVISERIAKIATQLIVDAEPDAIHYGPVMIHVKFGMILDCVWLRLQ